jgi:hypothetical protein
MYLSLSSISRLRQFTENVSTPTPFILGQYDQDTCPIIRGLLGDSSAQASSPGGVTRPKTVILGQMPALGGVPCPVIGSGPALSRKFGPRPRHCEKFNPSPVPVMIST